MPITGKAHQPPPAHQVFEGWNFVVCNFVPRKVAYHELAVMVDTFKPLELGEGGRAAEDPGYAGSWAGRGPQG